MRLRSRNYLNGILTINALLLGGLLWTQVAGRSWMEQSAMAAGPGDEERGGGVPNAADQRRAMIDALRRLEQNVDAANRAITGGKIKVHVTNIDELSSALSRARTDR